MGRGGSFICDTQCCKDEARYQSCQLLQTPEQPLSSAHTEQLAESGPLPGKTFSMDTPLDWSYKIPEPGGQHQRHFFHYLLEKLKAWETLRQGIKPLETFNVNKLS